MQGKIILNNYLRLPQIDNQAQQLKQALISCGARVDIVKNNCIAHIANNQVCLQGDKCEFVVYLDKDKYTARMLEKNNYRVFNSATSIELCDDKMATLIQLADNGIAIPDTIPAPLCYHNGIVDNDFLDSVEKKLGYPLVVKHNFGSQGKGVFLINNRAQLEDIANKLILVPHCYQQFVSTSYGRDIRVIVVGGEVVACMERTSCGDFRSNIELGGSGKQIESNPDLILLCKKIAQILELDYCGIDLLYGAKGYIVCEVNSNAFWQEISGISGINIAQKYANYIIKTINKS